MIKIFKKEYSHFRGAISVFLNRYMKVGDEIGFSVKNRHFIIKRDK